MSRWIVLLARVARDSRPAAELGPVAERVADLTGVPTRVAVLEGTDVPLTDVLTDASTAHVGQVVLVPVNTPTDRYLLAWTRRVVADWLARTPQPPAVLLSGAVPPVPAYAASVAGAADGPVERLTTGGPPLTVKEWSRITRHHHQVQVCRGPRCSALGAAAVDDAIEAELRRVAYGDDDVLVTRTGCLFPCDLGPVVVVQPDDAWLCHMEPARAGEVTDLVRQHTGRAERRPHPPGT